MRHRIRCHTRFDITATGIHNHYRDNQIPVAGTEQAANNAADYVKKRNQQRNWDTINQIISLRCLPENITTPTKMSQQQHTVWQFDFEVPDTTALQQDQQDLACLTKDSDQVPMIIGLEEDAGIGPCIVTGIDGNTKFEIVDK